MVKSDGTICEGEGPSPSRGSEVMTFRVSGCRRDEGASLGLPASSERKGTAALGLGFLAFLLLRNCCSYFGCRVGGDTQTITVADAGWKQETLIRIFL